MKQQRDSNNCWSHRNRSAISNSPVCVRRCRWFIAGHTTRCILFYLTYWIWTDNVKHMLQMCKRTDTRNTYIWLKWISWITQLRCSCEFQPIQTWPLQRHSRTMCRTRIWHKLLKLFFVLSMYSFVLLTTDWLKFRFVLLFCATERIPVAVKPSQTTDGDIVTGSN